MTNNDAIRLAVHKGYRVNRKGVVTSPSGKTRRLYKSPDGYLSFGVGMPDGKTRKVAVHRLIAYQKYGEAALENGIVTRHLNGDPGDNRWGNIRIGTPQENTMDQPPEQRQQRAQHAANHLRRFSNTQISKLRRERRKGAAYSVLAVRWSLSKSQLSYILSPKAKRTSNY